MRVLILSPYHGGSHRAWADGYRAHSRCDVGALTLPARFWKWRMHGAAVTLARRFDELERTPDLLLATDMLDLAAFLALTRGRSARLPAVLYMHENQVTYPLPDEPGSGPMRRQFGERDRHYGFVNWTSMLAADRVVFNSEYHRRGLLEELPRFLRHFPEHRETDALAEVEARSTVLPVGIDLGALLDDDGSGSEGQRPGDGEPLVIWNQRWEYDKDPEATLRALAEMADEGLDFRVALCGERFGRQPEGLEEARERLGSRIVHDGFAPRPEYARLLRAADVVVSTARHEFFGVAVLEAIACRSFPILPRRLSYPELLPERFHDRCLYRDEEGLLRRLRLALQRPQEARRLAVELAEAARRFAWARIAPRYDDELDRVVATA